MLGTLERAGTVLELFTEEAPEWGPTGVAAALSISKSQAFELLKSLSSIGLLERTNAGRYRLGWRILSLNSSLIRSSGVHQVSRAPMRRLAENLGETVHLAAMDRQHIVQVGHFVGKWPAPGPPARPGEYLPAHLTALGKVLLAFQTQSTALEMMQRDDAQTNGQREDLTRIGSELVQIRDEGFAYDNGSTIQDLRCIAAPVRDSDGHVVAAVALAASARRWDGLHVNYKRALRQTAAKISSDLARLPVGATSAI